jgi:hypothetical protein
VNTHCVTPDKKSSFLAVQSDQQRLNLIGAVLRGLEREKYSTQLLKRAANVTTLAATPIASVIALLMYRVIDL